MRLIVAVSFIRLCIVAAYAVEREHERHQVVDVSPAITSGARLPRSVVDLRRGDSAPQALTSSSAPNFVPGRGYLNDGSLLLPPRSLQPPGGHLPLPGFTQFSERSSAPYLPASHPPPPLKKMVIDTGALDPNYDGPPFRYRSVVPGSRPIPYPRPPPPSIITDPRDAKKRFVGGPFSFFKSVLNEFDNPSAVSFPSPHQTTIS
jgi:hypothetical protein